HGGGMTSQPGFVSGQWLKEAATSDSQSQQPRPGGTGMESTASSASSRGDTAALEATVRSLMTKDLVGDPAREISMFTVEYPPGSVDPVHTHHAQSLVYVLEGTIVMQVRGGTPVTLAPGQTFYEGPDDVHTVGRNASPTAPARFLVFLVKDKGAPI